MVERDPKQPGEPEEEFQPQSDMQPDQEFAEVSEEPEVDTGGPAAEGADGTDESRTAAEAADRSSGLREFLSRHRDSLVAWAREKRTAINEQRAERDRDVEARRAADQRRREEQAALDKAFTDGLIHTPGVVTSLDLAIHRRYMEGKAYGLGESSRFMANPRAKEASEDELNAYLRDLPEDKFRILQKYELASPETRQGAEQWLRKMEEQQTWEGHEERRKQSWYRGITGDEMHQRIDDVRSGDFSEDDADEYETADFEIPDDDAVEPPDTSRTIARLRGRDPQLPPPKPEKSAAELLQQLRERVAKPDGAQDMDDLLQEYHEALTREKLEQEWKLPTTPAPERSPGQDETGVSSGPSVSPSDKRRLRGWLSRRRSEADADESEPKREATDGQTEERRREDEDGDEDSD